MDSIKVKVTEIYPYENNPRNNDGAVQAVAESIKQCGYIAPIVVDENMVILAGHTRYRAITEELGWDVVDVIVVENLTEEQKTKYRILDNKTNEYAQWDFELLKQEAEGLDFGFDFGIDTLFTKADNLAAQEQTKMEPMTKKCTCPRCGTEFEE